MLTRDAFFKQKARSLCSRCPIEGAYLDLLQETYLTLLEKDFPLEEIRAKSYNDLKYFVTGVMIKTFKSWNFEKFTESRIPKARGVWNEIEDRELPPTQEELEAQLAVFDYLQFKDTDTIDEAHRKRLYYLFKEKGNLSLISRESGIPLRTLQLDWSRLQGKLRNIYEKKLNEPTSSNKG